MRKAKVMRRTVGIVVGLFLGWQAGGLLPGSLANGAPPQSEQVGDSMGHDAMGNAGERVEHGEVGHDEGGYGEVGHDPAAVSAQMLSPRDGHGHAAIPGWYPTVLVIVAGVFIAALLVGIAIVRGQRSPQATGSP